MASDDECPQLEHREGGDNAHCVHELPAHHENFPGMVCCYCGDVFIADYSKQDEHGEHLPAQYEQGEPVVVPGAFLATLVANQLNSNLQDLQETVRLADKLKKRIMLKSKPVLTGTKPVAEQEYLEILFSGPPGPGAECVFVEAEIGSRSINCGRWLPPEGQTPPTTFWKLRIDPDVVPLGQSTRAMFNALRQAAMEGYHSLSCTDVTPKTPCTCFMKDVVNTLDMICEIHGLADWRKYEWPKKE